MRQPGIRDNPKLVLNLNVEYAVCGRSDWQAKLWLNQRSSLGIDSLKISVWMLIRRTVKTNTLR